MKKGMYSGSFDPITWGHIDIIQRSSLLFDKLYIAIGFSQVKEYFLSNEERLNLVKEACKEYKNVEVVLFDTLAVDFAKKNDIKYIIRGLRSVTDFEYELQMTDTNKVLNEEIETVFMIANTKYSFLSSSVVKEVLKFNGDISKFVPENVEKYLKKKST